jgi:hypothetical protein
MLPKSESHNLRDIPTIMNTKLILRIAVAAIAIQFSRAQAEGELSLQFLAFPKQTDPAPIELLIGDGKTIPIEIPGHELSPVYKVSRLASIAVGLTTKNEKGAAVFQLLGKAPPLAASKQIILLLRKGENNSDGFVVLPIDGELAKFPGGNYLFINACKLAVGGKIGDKIFKLKPGQRDLIQPAATHEGGGCQVTLTYQDEEKWRIFYDTRWSVNKRYRSLIFFYQDPESGSVGVAPIVDFL